MSNSIAKFSFICGDDDFLVSERAENWFKSSKSNTINVSEDFSKEIINGQANNIEEVRLVLARFKEALMTYSMFGGEKVIWLKGVNFMGNSQTSNAKSTLESLGELKDILDKVDTSSLNVLISASPVHKGRNFYKWCINNSNFELLDDNKKGTSSPNNRIIELCSKSKVEINEGAIQVLLDKTQGNSRLISMEVEKIITYVGKSGIIDEAIVNEIVPNFGEGDFFEATDAFFSKDISWAIDAFERHFFSNPDGRALLSSLQSRNRLMIQLKILSESGELKLGFGGLSKNELSRIAKKYSKYFEEESSKSNLNIFTQNPYYLNRLMKNLKNFSLKELIDFQVEFANIFEAITSNIYEQKEIFKRLILN